MDCCKIVVNIDLGVILPGMASHLEGFVIIESQETKVLNKQTSASRHFLKFPFPAICFPPLHAQCGFHGLDIMYVYAKGWPTVFRGTYAQESVHRLVTLEWQTRTGEIWVRILLGTLACCKQVSLLLLTE